MTTSRPDRTIRDLRAVGRHLQPLAGPVANIVRAPPGSATRYRLSAPTRSASPAWLNASDRMAPPAHATVVRADPSAGTTTICAAEADANFEPSADQTGPAPGRASGIGPRFVPAPSATEISSALPPTNEATRDAVGA